MRARPTLRTVRLGPTVQRPTTGLALAQVKLVVSHRPISSTACPNYGSRRLSTATAARDQLARTSILPLSDPRLTRRLHASAADAEDGKSAEPLAPTDLLELYRGLVSQGKLSWDDEQVRCIMHLRRLLGTLETYQPPLDLLARLTPSAPYIAQQTLKGASASWWKGKSKALAGAGEYLGIDIGAGEEERRLVRVLSGEEELENLTTPKGILLTGPPGTGKSLLLSLFFRLLPVPKRRVHYHAFTLSLYRQVFEEMQKRQHALPVEEEGMRKVENMEMAGKRGWRAVFAGGRWDEEGKEVKWVREEGIPFIIARNMILEYHVLYFDELQLVDASSAALLRDVLSWYWRLGGVIVSCSNRVPEDLYHHGVQKDRMIGFLDALKSRCEVVTVDGGRDWRRLAEGSGEVRWYTPQETGFDEAWSEVVKGRESEQFERLAHCGVLMALGSVRASPITVYGRTVLVPEAAGTACRVTFEDLCENPLGPADYITLASTFSTLFIDAVPTLLLKHKNEARRLINLIDALYESRCQVYIRSSATPTTLFFPDAVTLDERTENEMTNERIMAAEALSETLAAPYRPNVSVYNTQTPSQRVRAQAEDARDSKGTAFSVLGIWTGEDERFAYKRAVSRLVEMTTSPTYAKDEWLPLDISLRTWERASTSTSTPASVSATSDSPSKTTTKLAKGGWTSSTHHERSGVSDDLAVEAGYSRPHRLTSSANAAFESDDQPLTPRSTSPSPSLSTRGGSAAKDESAMEEQSTVKEGVLYNPPKFTANHVWGVEDEWGPKAGRWGKGVKAFSESGKAEDDEQVDGEKKKDEPR